MQQLSIGELDILFEAAVSKGIHEMKAATDNFSPEPASATPILTDIWNRYVPRVREVSAIYFQIHEDWSAGTMDVTLFTQNKADGTLQVRDNTNGTCQIIENQRTINKEGSPKDIVTAIGEYCGRTYKGIKNIP